MCVYVVVTNDDGNVIIAAIVIDVVIGVVVAIDHFL